MTARLLSRRRLLTLSAVALGAGLAGGTARARPAWRWRGQALGGPASMVLYDEDRERARHALEACVAEIGRLEREFSLFRPDSAISRLNREGVLRPAGLDMIRLLTQAKAMHTLTDGTFDVTVQPLWRHLAEHPSAPPPDALLARVGCEKLTLSGGTVRFDEPGMAITLNGIAQGTITDRVAELLSRLGYDAVLMDLGEIRALAAKPDGSPWHVGLPGGGTWPLRNGAIATSSGDGLRFAPRRHHLLDPASGASPDHWRSMTVITTNATEADALSTAFFLMPAARIRVITDTRPVLALARRADGTTLTFGDWTF